MKIGVLSFQGGIDEHKYMVMEACRELKLSCTLEYITKPHQLDNVDGVILPGGESTAIVKLASRTGLISALGEKIRTGLPVFGTCAGAIILSERVRDYKTGKELRGTIGVLNTTIMRNYYGRQRESFEVDIHIPILGEKPFRAVFIRAPAIVQIGDNVKGLAVYEDSYVLVQQENILASTFHPELSGDTRIHKYFIELVKK